MEKGLISVDRWTGYSQAYFLTHLHSDHTQGLSSTWAKGPIFCSRLTAKLFPFKFPGFNLSLLRLLVIGTWHSVSLICPSSGSPSFLQVMAIDAHHCPGAVMFLFRGDFGCLLYTGDFRWETTSKRAEIGRSMLVDALKNDVVDILYLDNTYCNPSYVFPSREIAAQQIVDIIVSHPEHDIIIGIDTLGKEDLLLHISRALKIKIWVWPERLQTMHLLGFQDIFTTKTSLTRVRAVPRYSFSVETVEGLNTMHPTIGIMPSGLPWVVRPLERGDKLFGSLLTSRYNRSNWSGNGGNQTEKPNGHLGSVEQFHKYIYSVPYSDHSCFAEIGEFIKLVQPTNMKGIVTSSSCYVDPLYYFGRHCGANQPAQSLPHNKRKERGERVLAVKNKTTFSIGASAGSERKRASTVNIKNSGIHMSRVSALRRKKRGAKIVENDCPN
uniref:Protein artemis n=2 Tax=Fagus sylvatica TaxID=28930 RepID=A0A2N9I780_FAGSY